MREGFPAEEAEGGRGALWAGAVLDVLVVVFIVVHDVGTVTVLNLVQIM